MAEAKKPSAPGSFSPQAGAGKAPGPAVAAGLCPLAHTPGQVGDWEAVQSDCPSRPTSCLRLCHSPCLKVLPALVMPIPPSVSRLNVTSSREPSLTPR